MRWAVLFVAVIVSGCVTESQGDESQEERLYEYASTTFPVLVENVAAGQEVRSNLSFWTEDARNSSGRCPYGEGKLDYIMAGVWNRTGMVEFLVEPIDPFGDVDHTQTWTMPPEPPYLVLHTMTCGQWWHEVNIPHPDAKRLTTVPEDPAFPTPDSIKLIEMDPVSMEVVVPAGQIRGELAVPLTAEIFQVMVGFERFTPSAPVSGAVVVYEDWVDPDTEYARKFEYEVGRLSSATRERQHFPFPGDVIVEANVSNVWPVDVIFDAGTVSIHKFMPEITDYGFEYPFRSYVLCVDATADCTI